MQPSSTFVGVTAVVGAVALLGTGLASAAPVQWQDCTDFLGVEQEYLPQGLECGTLEVPVDYSQPDAGTTTVALTRMKARSGAAESTVFGNPGGPGNYALNYWTPRGDGSDPAGLYENHDLVAVQPRGLGGSDPLYCDGEFVGPVSLNPLHDACYGTDAAYMRSMTTENAARDMNAVRESLGLASIDFVGQSYGTAIGTDFATLYPEATGRFVLDSNTHPDQRWAQQAEATAEAQHARVYDIFAWIAERDDYYGLGDTPLKVFHSWKWVTDQEVGGAPNLTPPPAETSDLPTELRGTALEAPALDAINVTAPHRARAEGFLGAVTMRDLTNNAATGMFDATVGATYTDQAWPMVAHMLKYYNDGGTIARVDYPTAAKMVAAKEMRRPLLRTDAAMFEIITCNENASPANPLGVAAAKVDNIFGGNALVDQAAAEAAGESCLGWNPVATTVQPNGDALAQKPLIINSEMDPITPIAGAHRVLELMGGTLVTVGGGDHGTFRSGNPAVDDVVMQFLSGADVAPAALPGKPGPEPLPKWGQAERAAAAQQGMSAPAAAAPVAAQGAEPVAAAAPVAAPVAGSLATPVAGADDWYGIHRDAGAAQVQVQQAQVQQVQQQVQQQVTAVRVQAENTLRDVAGQVDAAARTLLTPPTAPAPAAPTAAAALG